MTSPLPIRACALLGACLAATPALADLTARDVWENWQASAETAGATMTAEDVSEAGDALTITGLVMQVDFPEGGFSTRVEDVTLTGTGDGSVRIAPAETYEITVDSAGDAGERFTIPMTLSHTDLDMVASGDPDAISYAYGAARIEIESGPATIDGESFDMSIAVALDTVTGRYDVESGTPQSFVSVFDAGAMAMSMTAVDAQQGTNVDMKMTLTGLASASNGTLSPFTMGPDVSDLLRNGAFSEGSARFGASSYQMDILDEGTQMNIEGSTESGTIDYRMDESGLHYSGGNTGVVMSVLPPGNMAPPVTFTIARTSGSLHMPVLSGEETQSFGLTMNLEGVELPEMLWSMIDMTGVLPRDPAHLELDLSGRGRLGFDFLDPDSMTALEEGGVEPGEVEGLDLNALRLSVAGAELTGSGSVDVDNSGPTPVPSGQVDLTLSGGNALIDKLVTIGILPEDQAMGARMMLGLFARPGAGEDELVSTIELREDGSVLANGQRIR